MQHLDLTAYDVAERYTGVKETPGLTSTPVVKAMLNLDRKSAVLEDETPWCSAFVNWICWHLRLPRSKSLAARSWLGVGRPISLQHAVRGFDIVVLQRGVGTQPGPEVIAAPGHVGFYSAFDFDPSTNQVKSVALLGGNQADAVNVQVFPVGRVLGVRRLLE